MEILVKLLDDTARVPIVMREGDAAFDLYASESGVILSGTQKLVSTGIAIVIPHGFVGLIWDRSGLAAKQSLLTMGGVIDSNYRGEIKVILRNLSDTDYAYAVGDRIAQMIIQKHEVASFTVVTQLPESTRNDGAFGSSGK
jgi:dUTP pyrophosphatase